MNNLNSKLEGQKIEWIKRSNKALVNPKIKVSPKINKMIENAENVYLAADWHLWKANKQTGIVEKGKRFNVIISELQRLKPNDLLIFMGDIVDDEFEDQEAIERVLSLIKCKTIMVLGNNDMFELEFYERNFDIVVEGFQYGNLVLTHFPIQVPNTMINIHGHLHGGGTYYEPHPRSIDCYSGGRFKTLEEMVNAFNRRR